MADVNGEVENHLNHQKNAAKSTRLGWKSRCREMQGIRWGKKSRNGEERGDGRQRWSEPVTFNEEFETYYRNQKICREDEWEEFLECSKRSLPVSFRLNTSAFLWRRTRDKMKKMCDTEELQLSTPVDYRPDYLKREEDGNIYYQMKTDKESLKKNEKFTKFHQFLMMEDTRGALCRQETVSMLPVIFLDPKPNENILDLCAAPGMKYLQIVDTVESRLKSMGVESPMNRGIIMGNDVSQTRVSTLAHHLKTIDSPSTCLTNYDATRFPNLYCRNGEQLKFDKILADMPCSCDGTMRKSIDIWNSWKSTNGLHMHKVQLSILKRGVELLKPGGELVYSTCSLNPLENEAIANSILVDGEVELVELQRLKGFKFETGLSEWLVPGLDGGYYREFSEVELNLRERIKETMFKTENWNREKANKVMRVLPHYNNTGGFFIFKIKKKTNEIPHNSKELKETFEQEKEQNHTIEKDNNNPFEEKEIFEEESEKKIERKRLRGAKLLHEYREFKGEDYENIRRYYGIDEELNFGVKLSSDRSVYLQGDSKGSIAYKRNKNGKFEKVKYASLGTRVFTKLETKDKVECEFRITQEGSKVLHRFVNRRKLLSNLGFLKALLEGGLSEEEFRRQEEEKNVLAKECKGTEGNLENGSLLLVSTLDHGKLESFDYGDSEFVTLAAVAIGGKIQPYAKEELIKSLKILL